MSILHTPESYKDKLSNESLTYKYPKTARPGNYDTNEIQATKRCQQFKLPLFIVIGNQADADREVRLGKVVECDDETRCFRIRFSTGQRTHLQPPATSRELRAYLVGITVAGRSG